MKRLLFLSPSVSSTIWTWFADRQKVESGVGPSSCTATGASPSSILRCSSSSWKETRNKAGKRARSSLWAGRAESHGLCWAASVGRLENLLQPAPCPPDDTCNSTVLFSVTVIIPLAPRRGVSCSGAKEPPARVTARSWT